MNVLDYYQKGFNEVSKNLVPWVLFYFVFGIAVTFSCGLAGVFSASALREVRDALAGGRGPEIGNIFRTDQINNDAVNWLIFLGAVMLGSLVGGIGGTIAGVLLQMHMPLAAENRFLPMDNAKLSVRHVSAHAVDHIVFFIASGVLIAVASMLCFVPVLVAVPVAQAAMWLWYMDSREEINGFAQTDGIKSIEGPV